MNCAILIDWGGAPDFPENDAMALGRALAAYPLMAAKASTRVHRRFVVSSAQPIKSAALQYGAVILDPPAAEKTPAAGLLAHAARQADQEAKKEGERLELLIVLCAQAPSVTGTDIDAGIDALQEGADFDCALSLSKLPDWLLPAAPEWRPNGSLMIFKAARLASGNEPSFWTGKKVFPIKQLGVWPIEYRWQIPALEAWLQKQGVSSAAYAPEPQPQVQKSAKPAASRPTL